jgi:transcriptional regulator with XRE-family HTH domain
MTTLGQRLRELREKLGLTQTRAAQLIGISNVVLNRYEKNERRPDPDTLKRIADVYGADIDYLLCRNENEKQTADDKPSTSSSIFKTLFGDEPDPVRDAIKEYVRAYLHDQREAILDNHDVENSRELYDKVGQFIDKNVSRIASRAFRNLRITDYDYIKNTSILPENVINHIREIINVELLALSVTEQEEKPILDRWDQLKKDLLDSLNPDRMTINGDTSSFVYDPDLFLQFGNLPKKMTPEYLKDLEESLKRVDEKLKQLKPGDPPIWEIDPRKYDKR